MNISWILANTCFIVLMCSIVSCKENHGDPNESPIASFLVVLNAKKYRSPDELYSRVVQLVREFQELSSKANLVEYPGEMHLAPDISILPLRKEDVSIQAYRLDYYASTRHVSVAPHRAFAVNQERSEEHTSELQSLTNLVCRLLLEKKKTK